MRWNAQSWYTDYRRLLDESPADAVLVLTPPEARGDIVLEALSHGKHVLCEKPLALSSGVAGEIVLAAQSRGRVVMALPYDPAYPSTQLAKTLVASGAIGTAVMAEGRMFQSGPIHAAWLYGSRGGALWDVAVYPLTLLLSLFGSPIKAWSAQSVVRPYRRLLGGVTVRAEANDNVIIAMKWSTGLLGSAYVSFAVGGLGNVAVGGLERSRVVKTTTLLGTEGIIHITGPNEISIVGPARIPAGLAVSAGGYEGLSARRVTSGRSSRLDRETWYGPEILSHFLDCIRNGREPVPNAALQLQVIQILEEVDATSSSGGRRVCE